ncbi:unnamed protein product [Lota lota]
MGATSSLLDETTSNYIKDQVESELKAFSPYYRKQYSVTHFSRVEDELEQNKQKTTQLLKQREAPEAGEVLYENAVYHFDETRKWKERYVVVRANYCLECHDSLESFIKGAPARYILLPTGGTVLTTEEKYMGMVDQCFPDTTSNVKEEFAPSMTSLPGQFPVYLRLPYRRDYYFCFKQEARQAGFLSILSACIRHQNQDFLKKKTCEVQAFLKAIQLYRQEKGKYEAWDMMIGSDVRVMANLVMEQLLPALERDMLPRLKAKKTERKRMWFATVEASYILVQEHLMEGLSLLKKECDAAGRQQEVLIHSDMDQIISSRALLEDKLRASVLEPAERFSSEGVQPYLASVLEELMEPISSGFMEGRGLSEALMDELCQDLQTHGVTGDLKQQMAQMSRPNLLSCYQRIGSLNENTPHLQERFGFSNTSSLIHSAQIDLQQLMENAAYTFELMLQKAVQDEAEQAASTMEKAKHRVLKQYDYDSSTVRKKLFQDALVAITLPHIKKNLATVCKPELQRLEQSIYVDHSHFVHVENVYESVLLQMLDKEVTKVVKEAASLRKYNLLNDSRDLLSQSSRSNLFCSTPSTPRSPSWAQTPSTTAPSPEPQPSTPCMPPAPAPAPPLVPNGLERADEGQRRGSGDVAAGVAAPVVQEDQEAQEDQEDQEEVGGGSVEVRSVAGASLGRPDDQTKDTDANDTGPAPDVPAASATPPQSVTAATEVATVTRRAATTAPAAPETTGEAAPVHETTTGGGARRAQEAAQAAVETAEEERRRALPLPANKHTAPEIEAGAPSSGAETEGAGGDCGGAGSGPAPPGSVESREKEGSTPPHHTEEEEEEEEEEVSSSDPQAGASESSRVENPGAQVPSGADGSGSQEANQTVVSTLEASPSGAPEGPASGCELGVMDSVKEIRDLVAEVIDVEELVQRYPDGVPPEEE